MVGVTEPIAGQAQPRLYLAPLSVFVGHEGEGDRGEREVRWDLPVSLSAARPHPATSVKWRCILLNTTSQLESVFPFSFSSKCIFHVLKAYSSKCAFYFSAQGLVCGDIFAN
jgi:hypothetical protein